MRNSVADLKEDVQAILTGIDLNEVPNLYGSFERAVSTFIQKADVPETMIRQPIMLYSGVTFYTPDPRMFGTAVIDIRPQAINTWAGQVYKRPISDFKQLQRRLPYGYTVTFEYQDGDPIMGIIQGNTVPQITIAEFGSLGDGINEQWALLGDANSLAVDNTVYYQSPTSLRFNLNALGNVATAIYQQNTPTNLSGYEGVGVVFLAAYFPYAADITKVSLILSSDDTLGNSIQIDVTEGFLGPLVSNQFQLLAFALGDPNAIVSGTPDFSNILTVAIEITYNGTAQNSVRLGALFAALPTPHEMLFYSAAVFREGTSGPFSVNISTDGQGDENEVIFRDAAYNIYVQEAAREIAKNQGALAGSGMITEIDEVLEGGGNKTGLYDQYRGDNPSEELRQVDNWYDEGYASDAAASAQN